MLQYHCNGKESHMEEMYIIATNEDGVIFGNYFTEVMTLEQAKKKLVGLQYS